MFLIFIQVHSFERKYKDDAGKYHFPGVKDLPYAMQPHFRNTFIRHIMKIVFSGMSPWSNPTLPVYQQEFNQVYPQLAYHLHSDDAVVMPTNRNLGVLRNQIGAEGLQAVIKFLPSRTPNICWNLGCKGLLTLQLLSTQSNMPSSGSTSDPEPLRSLVVKKLIMMRFALTLLRDILDY